MEEKDIGFGQKSSGKGTRFIREDGSINVIRKGLPFFRPYDSYHALITMNWGKFLLIIFLGFFALNALFALLYSLLPGIEISTISTHSWGELFWENFFFSIQTFSTVGYGTMSPISFEAKMLSAFESFVGLVGLAIMTGILYGRFSNPNAKIKYSKKMLIAPFGNGKALMFKMANQRSSKLIEAEVTMVVNYLENGKRHYQNLELQLRQISFFALTWTVVHPIDEKSFFHQRSKTEVEASDAEIIILVKAFDDTFSQTVYSRRSYKPYDLEWNAKFDPSIMEEDGQMMIDLDQLDNYQKL